MIGVIADSKQHPVVEEFFQLFKTPWEFFKAGSSYEAVLCSGEPPSEVDARLVLIFNPKWESRESENRRLVAPGSHSRVLTYRGDRFPIYGASVTFGSGEAHPLKDEGTQEPAAQVDEKGSQRRIHIGFDLFHEVHHLLTTGQPPAWARTPTLDLHIALVRDLMVESCLPVVEIPPVPTRHSFIACLTHDVDHVGIRNHKCDHTMFGFLYRAIVGSVVKVCRGRMTMRQLCTNWAAVLRLPFVHMGIAKDFWYQFDRYREIEAGLKSTFFVVPFKGHAGVDTNGAKPSKRATRYDVSDIVDEINGITAGGGEVSLHGLDAWIDSREGLKERERIAKVTGAREIGVRMHWLCFGEQSPRILEEGGFAYDSTVGYNECVGFRSGTSQVFKLVGTANLLELPMHIMDTALFYPSHMNLDPADADAVVDGLFKNATRFGGVMTINWHDRSVAPERLWGDFYIGMLGRLKMRGPWFAKGLDAVRWFKLRRAAALEEVRENGRVVRVRAKVSGGETGLPGMRLRVSRRANARKISEGGPAATPQVTDKEFESTAEVCLAA
ncbi:MAG: hypothetical protein ABMA01_00085 [Chthoniobacteraceae bacterium]